MKNSILKKIILIVGIGFIVSLAYAETAEEYYKRTGNAVVYQPGGGFTKAYIPRQDSARRDEITAYAPQSKYDTSPQAEEYNRQGISKVKSGDYYQAIQYFTRAIEIQPKFPEAFHNRGLAYSASGDHHQAIVEYNRSLELNPNNPVVYYDRAVDYSTMNNFSQVIADCTQAIKLGYYFGSVYALRGAAYNHLKDYEKAYADLLAANARGGKISQALIKEVKDKMKAKRAALKSAKAQEEEKKPEQEKKE